jgi:hypothetical protein
VNPGGGILYHKTKRQQVSTMNQKEDKNTRFDYGKTRVDFSSGIVGENENIRDSR